MTVVLTSPTPKFFQVSKQCNKLRIMRIDCSNKFKHCI
jgi:hypothetical protein